MASRPGLWANIHAKRKRIKAGSGEKMRKKGDPGAPTEENIRKSQARKGGLKDRRAKSGAWTRKEGQNSSGGLNEKGRRSYERENPGSDLKAPQPEGGARKKSFCARMCGMKKRRTGSKGKSDPNSRINKALRKWKCSC
jgi:hypothetical protein